jgi:rare lipoprotein A
MKMIIGCLAFLASYCIAQAQSWTGKASYYGGRGHMACAHRSLPFGTHVRVTNLSNHRTAVLVVNDRGPFIQGRIIDVSTGSRRYSRFPPRWIGASDSRDSAKLASSPPEKRQKTARLGEPEPAVGFPAIEAVVTAA